MSELAAFSSEAPEPQQSVVEALSAQLKMAREEVQNVRTQLTAANSRAAGLELALAQKNIECVHLRRGLHTAKQAADPNIVQVRQLLLDPAVQREFRKMRADADAKAHEAKLLHQELSAVAFSQESKTGRMLMAKCRTLQEENEDMGRELAEGKVHALERAAALAKGFGDDMRRQYAALETHAHALDRENEELQGQVFTMRRQLDGASSGGQSGARQGGKGGGWDGHHTGYKRQQSQADPQDSWDGGRSDSRRRMR
mmetsp:Transcript_14418/g.43614  ORF Transcript_14418/g.43614 Transcript_14418/m.43614 type:complete len:256 (-) Transcript_14418:387-1154(-)